MHMIVTANFGEVAEAQTFECLRCGFVQQPQAAINPVRFANSATR